MYSIYTSEDLNISHSIHTCFNSRIQQCMGNQKPMWYKNGEVCDQKVYFEDWESKYTPGSWDSSSQFETLQECKSFSSTILFFIPLTNLVSN